MYAPSFNRTVGVGKVIFNACQGLSSFLASKSFSSTITPLTTDVLTSDTVSDSDLPSIDDLYNSNILFIFKQYMI
ncbi:hypothetical protein Ark11_1433 [Candidatus Ichthyocystis hellenicum]|uniref:Uncharacterized protein n=1 Tax=Candidatus Ichthyocystis hellenicum TaxID=1561003 RepID=A0A0S4M7W5_9BURK|nr:hypothetical protein Ark11_1433 [Candidatus Ichthyocystis hellenicum]